MNEQARVTALLTAVADQVDVGAAPVQALQQAVRRRRRLTGLASALALVLVAGGAALLVETASTPRPESLVTAPDAPEPDPEPELSPSLSQLRPAGPRTDLVVEGGPLAEVYLDSVGGARTDPLDPALLVVSIPAGQAGSGPEDAGTRCWWGATARATADGDVVRLEPLTLVNARPAPEPSRPPGVELVCNLSLGSTQVVVPLPGPLAGRTVVLPGDRVLEVADGALLPITTAVPEGWVFRSSGAGSVRYESRTDRAVAADLHAGTQPDPDAFVVVDRFEVAPGREAVVSTYGPRGFRVGWSDDAGPLWADVAGLPLEQVRDIVRGVVRAGDAYAPVS